jgi:dTDP-4-amino-4,6-dideoxygalactose transaminase
MNLRLPELSAAVATVQMKKLKKMLELRRRNAEMLSKMIYPVAKKHGLKIPEETTDKKFNWYLYTVAFESGRDRIKDALNKAGVGATVYYNPPVHRTPYYAKQTQRTSLPSTDWCADHVLSLPVHPNVTEADVARIVKSLDAAL